jgi:hypothetical protein
MRRVPRSPVPSGAPVRAWTDRFDLRVAESDWPRPSPTLRQVFREALEPDPDPGDLVVFLEALFDAWRSFLFLSACLMGALAFIGYQIGGDAGDHRGLAIGAFLVGFCLVGEFGTAFRLRWARRARRHAGFESTVNERASRPMLAGRVNDGGVILQLFGGFIASVIALSLG